LTYRLNERSTAESGETMRKLIYAVAIAAAAASGLQAQSKAVPQKIDAE
jgi:hypothetical protein